MELLVLAYFIGSFPTAVVLAKVMGLPDPRSMGSGNPGATNMVRNGGRGAGAVTFLLDALKGAMAVLYAQVHAYPYDFLLWLGVCVVVGHMFPLWLRFRGGKGVATCLGAMSVALPLPTLAAVLVWALVWKTTRHVFLGSLMIPVVLLGGVWLMDCEFTWSLCVMMLLIWGRHYTNIRGFYASM